MKKYICLLLVMALCFGIMGCGDGQQTQSAENVQSLADNQAVESDGESETNYVFRYANWGDDVETVASKEKNDFYHKTKDTLGYTNIKLYDYNTNVSYSFDESGFYSGIYFILESHSTGDAYIEDFNTIETELTKKYGEPSFYDDKWDNDVNKDNHGAALLNGQVEFCSIWMTENVDIVHKLSGDVNEIDHGIIYMDPNNKNH